MLYKRIFVPLFFVVSVYCHSQNYSNNTGVLTNDSEMQSFINKTSHITTIRHIDVSSPDEYSAYIRSYNADSLINEAIKKLNLLSNISNYSFLINDYDKIVTFDNEVLFVKVQHITFIDVRFLYPLNINVESISREKVSQIIYANGNIDLFIPFDEANKDSLNYKDDRLIIHYRKSWEKIAVTETEEEVSDMLEIGPVNSIFTADRIQANNNFLEKNGLIILKRKAANLNADYILITKKVFNKRYGAFPSVKFEGTAYKYNEGL